MTDTASHETGLVRYDTMCRAIDAAHQIDEVKDIRDKAMALQVYARQAQNTEAERRAAQIRMRAERKTGQLLKETANAKPGPKGELGRGDRPNSVPTLSALGITKDQSSQWQRMADMGEEQFSRAIGESASPPTTGGVLRSVEAQPVLLNNSAGEAVRRDSMLLWGCLCDFEKLLDKSADDLMENMTDTMQDTAHRLAPKVAAWLRQIGRLK